MMEPLVLSAGHQLRDRAEALAEATVACEYRRFPALRTRYGPTGRARSRADSLCHFACLADAVDFDSLALFDDYIGWAKVLLENRGVRGEDLEHHLACMAEAVREQLPAPVAGAATAMIEAAQGRVPGMPSTSPSLIDTGHRLSALAREYLHALLGGYRAASARLVLDAAARGERVPDLYLHVFQPALREVGRLWQTNAITVAQEHFCSAATQVAMSQLLPDGPDSAPGAPGVVVVSVTGDLHDLGGRMVADFFAMAGWNVYFCGASTPHAGVVQAVTDRAANVLAVSASMASHLHTVQELLGLLRADPRCGEVRVMVGGRPFGVDASLWRKVGADGSADDAAGAVRLAQRWVGGSHAA